MLVVMPDELEIVWAMQPLDRDIFMYLCQRCDLQSGVIGRSQSVSYGGMALDLTERAVARRRKDTLRKVSSKQVENAVARLVAAGLLVRLSQLGQGELVVERVFLARCLGLGQSVQNRDGRQLGGKLVDICAIFNNKNNVLKDSAEVSRELNNASVGTTLYK